MSSHSSTTRSSGAETAEILAYLDELLTPESFEDYGPNGLQVPGPARVTRVLTGVSGQLELFEQAARMGAELVLVHHGILWNFQPSRLTRERANRLRVLLSAGIALAAYHLPLDAHPSIGNNALIAQRLGCVERKRFGLHRGASIGVAGRFPQDGLPHGELLARIQELTGRVPLALGAGPERIRGIGIVSGAGAESFGEAVELGLDAFLTGEPREHVTAEAREAGVHFIAAGHYATETFGIRRLGQLVAERFEIEHNFLDIPNPV